MKAWLKRIIGSIALGFVVAWSYVQTAIDEGKK